MGQVLNRPSSVVECLSKTGVFVRLDYTSRQGIRPEGLMERAAFHGVKVFSATTANDRATLGERLTAWLRAHPQVEIVDKTVVQSSDERFHCITIVVFYTGDAGM